MDRTPPGSSVHGISQAGILKWVSISSPGDLPNQRLDLCLLYQQVEFLIKKPSVKPRNTVLLTKPFPWIRTALSSQPTRTVLGVVIAIAVVVIVTFLYDHSFTNVGIFQ